MRTTEIKSRYDGLVLWSGEAGSLRDAAVAAVKSIVDLRGADLRGAYLRGAYLRGARINWQSHALIAELLRRAAGDDAESREVRQRRAFVGLVAVSEDWCWDVWTRMRDWHPEEAEWALSVLAEYVRDGDEVPAVVREAAAKRSAE